MLEKIGFTVIKKYLIAFFFLIVIVLLAYEKLFFYVRFDFNFVLLLIVLPFVIEQKSRDKSIRYGIIAICLLLLYAFVKLSSVYFFAFICSLFFLYESHIGKLSVVPLFLVLIVSPVVIFLSEIIGFEIRLYLTWMAAQILFVVDRHYRSNGNIIMHNEDAFSVDPECMGLNMVLLSLFITLIFISVQQKKYDKTYNFISIILALVFVYFLVVVSNLFRIILITFFKAYPDSISHQLIGIICLFIYVVIPIWFFIKILPNKKSEIKVKEVAGTVSRQHFFIVASLLLSFFLVFKFSSWGLKNVPNVNLSSIRIDISSFNKSVEEHGVLKLANQNLLMYIKPHQGFYTADHSPIICWKGSGYIIQKEQIMNLSEKKVFFSELKQENEILYTTWWYDCGDDKTVSQFRWRTQNLFAGKDYRLVNVISYDKNILFKETKKLLVENIFY